MANSSIRMGVDIGGTFTDVVLEIDGQYTSTKVLTTYAAPEDAIDVCISNTVRFRGRQGRLGPNLGVQIIETLRVE